MAGPMQQDAAKNEVSIVPRLDTFSVFISGTFVFSFKGIKKRAIFKIPSVLM
jgi:hypothetical protein